jgi:resolvase-like protein
VRRPPRIRSRPGAQLRVVTRPVTGLLIGYARVSTDAQDLTAQRNALTTLGVDPARLYVDPDLTDTNRE